MNQERIDSLRKEKRMAENFESRGILPIFSEINFSVKTTDDANAKYKKLISSIKRSFKKHFETAGSIEEKQEMINLFVKTPYNIKLELLSAGEDDYLIKLLFACIKKSIPSNVESYMPARVCYQKGEKLITGYTLLNYEIPKSIHDTSRKLRSVKSDKYDLIVDIVSTVAAAATHNTLVKFVKHNREYIQYQQVLAISKQCQKHEKRLIPADENSQFAMDLISTMHKHDMPFLDVWKQEELPSSVLEENDYYLPEDESGNIPDLYKSRSLIIPRFVETVSYVKDKTEREFDDDRSYAAAFQEKKNITQRIRSVMEDNKFLQRYGVVELDNDTDLEKFKELEEDFVALMDKVYIPTALDHSFRIRKLGKHRAAGLYFPFYKATVFDLDHPSAFSHELSHQIDYTHGDRELLSEKFNFYPIFESYKEIVIRRVMELGANDPFKNVWEGKTKYNANYYLQYTEVFARCYEMYMFHSLDIRSSLLQEKYDSPVYPDTSHLLERVEKYFRMLDFSTNSKSKIVEEKKVVASSEYPIFTDHLAVEEGGQLSLF